MSPTKGKGRGNEPRPMQTTSETTSNETNTMTVADVTLPVSPQADDSALEPDSLTIFECIEGKRATKLFTESDQPSPKVYDAGFLFTPYSVPVSNLDDIARELEGLRTKPRRLLVHGQLRPDAQRDDKGLVSKRKIDYPGFPAPLQAAEHWWMYLDDDESTVAFDADDPIGSVKRWRATLPAGLCTAAMVFRFSASQHLHKTIRGHAYFWLDEPLGGATLKLWAERHGFDHQIYDVQSTLNTADPIFEGCTDPLEGKRDLVRLPGGLASLDLTDAERCAVSTASDATRTGAVRLSDVGAPSDEPDAVKARAKVVKQLEDVFSWGDGTGRRRMLSGALGGACAKMGIPEEETLAILTDLRAPDVSDQKFLTRINWAMGAYGLDDREKALGVKGIKELTSDQVSIQVENWLRRLAEATAPAPEPANDTAPAVAKERTLLECLQSLGRVADLSKPDVPPAYVCAGLTLAPGKVSGVCGYAGVGKGPFINYLAVCLASGKPLFGILPVKRCKVLLWDHETGPEADSRLKRIANALGEDIDQLQAGGWLVLVHATPPIKEEDVTTIRELVVRHNIESVLQDSYTSAVEGDQNSREIADAAFALGAISNETGAVIVPTLHSRKPSKGNQPSLIEMLSGHNALAAAFQTILYLSRPKDADENLIEVRCARAPRGRFKPFCFRWEDVAAPGTGKGLGSRLAGEKWGLRPVVVETTAEAVAKATIDAKQRLYGQQVIVRLSGISGQSERALLRNVPGGSREMKLATLQALVDEGVLEPFSTATVGKNQEAIENRNYSLAKRGQKNAEAFQRWSGTA